MIELGEIREKRQQITEREFLEGKIGFKAPQALSFRDREYFARHSKHFTASDIESLCAILLHSPEEIFTGENIRAINSYDFVKLGKEKQLIGSGEVKDILKEISSEKDKQQKQDRMNDILYDASQKLSKHKPDQLKLKVRVYNNLIGKEYIKISPNKIPSQG